MRRAPLVAAGTALGAAGVLAFPVQHPQLAGAAPAAVAAASATPSAAASAAAIPAAASTSATGTAESYRYGSIAVKVTVGAGKITDVTVANLQETDRRSASIDSYAIPQLEQRALSAGSANIQGVSGATFTSEAFAASLKSALTKLGFKA